jgi:hypothetical protein
MCSFSFITFFKVKLFVYFQNVLFSGELTLTASDGKKYKTKSYNLDEQYPTIEIKAFNKSHDRFLIIDRESVYHIGASLKDLGKKWFAFSKIEIDPNDLILKLN